MTLAIKWGEDVESSGFIFFDAVTAYSKNYTGTVTKHPIDRGGSIVDHFVQENPRITLTGVITGVDVATGSFTITDDEGNQPLNVRPAPSPVTIASTNNSLISRVIPSSIGQFLSEDEPEVFMDGARGTVIAQIEDLLTSLVYSNANTGLEFVTLYEYEGSIISRALDQLIITGLKFDESPDNGRGLYCDITFERVNTTTVSLAPLPDDIVAALRAQAAGEASQGRVDSTEENAEDGESEEAEKASTLYQGGGKLFRTIIDVATGAE